jgi:hypothetical protein
MVDVMTRYESWLALILVAVLSCARVEEAWTLALTEVKLVCDVSSLTLVNRHAVSLAGMTPCLPAEALFDFPGPVLFSALAESEAVGHLWPAPDVDSYL